MSTAAATEHASSSETQEFLTVIIAGQRFGIPILQIEDVLGEHKITKIPMASPEIAGALNLRGRIVTAIDVRQRIGLAPLEHDKNHKHISVVVSQNGELYALGIDKVGDVMNVHNDRYEKNPGTLDPVWKDVSAGIYRLEGELLIILNIPKLLRAQEATH